MDQRQGQSQEYNLSPSMQLPSFSVSPEYQRYQRSATAAAAGLGVGVLTDSKDVQASLSSRHQQQLLSSSSSLALSPGGVASSDMPVYHSSSSHHQYSAASINAALAALSRSVERRNSRDEPSGADNGAWQVAQRNALQLRRMAESIHFDGEMMAPPPNKRYKDYDVDENTLLNSKVIRSSKLAQPYGKQYGFSLTVNDEPQLRGGLKAVDSQVHLNSTKLSESGVCQWPGCGESFDGMEKFALHLEMCHRPDEHGIAQARVQMQMVVQLERQVEQERTRLRDMLAHMKEISALIMLQQQQQQDSYTAGSDAEDEESRSADSYHSGHGQGDLHVAVVAAKRLYHSCDTSSTFTPEDGGVPFKTYTAPIQRLPSCETSSNVGTYYSFADITGRGDGGCSEVKAEVQQAPLSRVGSLSDVAKINALVASPSMQRQAEPPSPHSQQQQISLLDGSMNEGLMFGRGGEGAGGSGGASSTLPLIASWPSFSLSFHQMEPSSLAGVGHKFSVGEGGGSIVSPHLGGMPPTAKSLAGSTAGSGNVISQGSKKPHHAKMGGLSGSNGSCKKHNVGPGKGHTAGRSLVPSPEELEVNYKLYKDNDVRPPYTYAALIRQAIIEATAKKLALNEIYEWFLRRFSYFQKNQPAWKNAIRHNLSIHKCFMREECSGAPYGAVWTVNDELFFGKHFVKYKMTSRSSDVTSSGDANRGDVSSTSSLVDGECQPSSSVGGTNNDFHSSTFDFQHQTSIDDTSSFEEAGEQCKMENDGLMDVLPLELTPEIPQAVDREPVKRETTEKGEESAVAPHTGEDDDPFEEIGRKRAFSDTVYWHAKRSLAVI